MTIDLTGLQARRVREAVAQVKSDMDNMLKPQLTSAVGQYAGMPQQLTDFNAEITGLQGAISGGSAIDAPASIPDSLAPILATVVAYHRRNFVKDLERQRARAVAGELLHNIDDAKAVLDDMLKAKWYIDAKPLKLPRLRDFVTESLVDMTSQLPPPPRHMDDKFGILLSASHLLPDLEEMRRKCGERSAPVAIAFVDVDRLKALNTELGETWVDALILPPILRSVERASYGHGYAYRYGGDEFVVIIPSADRHVALAILQRLQEDLSRTLFETIPEPPTISIGLCVLDPDSPLTDREALHWAALAKKEAKTVRDVVAVVDATREIDNPKIEVLRPKRH